MPSGSPRTALQGRVLVHSRIVWYGLLLVTLGCALPFLDTDDIEKNISILLVPHRVSVTVTGLNGNMQLVNNGGDMLDIRGSGTYTFSRPLMPWQTYEVHISKRSYGEACLVEQGAGVILLSDASSVRMNCWTDAVVPVVAGTVPADMATGVDPRAATLSVRFDGMMQTELIPSLTTEIWDGSSWVTVDSAGTIVHWVSSDTLNIELSWVRLPENARVRWTLSNNELQDLGSNPLPAPLVRVFDSSALNAYFPLADTGQSTCYYQNAGVWTTDSGCGLTYTVGSSTHPLGQDAHYAGSPLAPGLTGPNAHPGNGPDRTTDDAVTGLSWKTCVEGQSGPSCGVGAPGAFTWYQAINACAYLNVARAGVGYAGLKGWRLATRFEMDSISDLDLNPALHASLFPNGYSGDHATVSSECVTCGNAWHTAFLLHADDSTGSRTGSYAVRCVTGPASTASRILQDQGDGTISDSASGLIWQKCALGRFADATCSDDGATADTSDWAAAVATCENLIYASRTDWRLPSGHELVTLVDHNRSAPAIDPALFPATASSGYWTSTTAFSAGGMQGYSIDFLRGTLIPGDQATARRVRCVAGP